MGPDGEANPTLSYYICAPAATDCSTDDLQHRIDKRQEYLIDAIVSQNSDSSQKGLDFKVAGHEDWSRYAPPDSGDIKGFKFYLFSNPKKDFHVIVDELKITYT
jgi:hypothetical protein